MPRQPQSIFCSLTVSLLMGAVASSLAAQDWSQWRGADRTGVAVDFEPPVAWPEALQPLWEVEVGRGDASPVVAGDRIYTWTREGDDEVASAWSRATGERLWRSLHPAPFKPLHIVREHGAGPYSTPIYDDGRLYAVGILGQVVAFDAETGERLWRREFEDEFRFPRPFYGAAQSPLAVDGQLLVSVGGAGGGALLALDPATGEDRWRLDLEGPSYGSGLIGRVAGEEILIMPTRKRLLGVDPESGRQLWEFPFEVRSDDWSLTPLVTEDVVLISQGNGPTLGLRLEKSGSTWTVEESWTSGDFWLRFSSPVLVNGKVVAFAEQNKGQMVVALPETGEVVWRGEPRQGETAWLLAVPGHVIAVLESGRAEIYSIGDEIEQVASYDDLTTSAVWAHPARSGQQLFIKDQDRLRAFAMVPAP